MKDEDKKDDNNPQEQKKSENNTYNGLTILLGTARILRLPNHLIEDALKIQKT